MNKKITLLLLLPFIFFLSCDTEKVGPVKEDPKDDPKIILPVENALVNDWIYNKMKEFYFWESEMIPKSETNLAKSPDEYFESILVQKGEVDRFSWIQESAEDLRNLLDGVSSILGFKYSPFYADAAQTRIAYSLSYVMKNSAAERAGLKRGDFITKVDGVDINLNNYSSLLKPETVTLTLGNFNNGTVEHTENAVELTREITQVDALQHYSILDLDDKKIGYFVYTQFLTKADRSLNNMFAEFKSEGVNELVVDLRFNPGGYISSAELLSSLIVRNLNVNNLMTKQVWNEEQSESYKSQYGAGVFDTYFFTNRTPLGNVNNIGDLDRVYFLVSSGSASASELLINNLKPYMDVILVGTHTYGKNVGSITIDDSEDPQRWEWGMQPIVLKSFNGNGNSDYGTKNGFLPDIEIKDNNLPFKDFGDPDETLLHAALSDMLSDAVLAKIGQKAKVAPGGKFNLLLDESLSDNPILDRKDMWVTGLPKE